MRRVDAVCRYITHCCTFACRDTNAYTNVCISTILLQLTRWLAWGGLGWLVRVKKGKKNLPSSSNPFLPRYRCCWCCCVRCLGRRKYSRRYSITYQRGKGDLDTLLLLLGTDPLPKVFHFTFTLPPPRPLPLYTTLHYTYIRGPSSIIHHPPST